MAGTPSAPFRTGVTEDELVQPRKQDSLDSGMYKVFIFKTCDEYHSQFYMEV